MTIHKYLDLANSHLTEQDVVELQDTLTQTFVRVASHEFGWIVFIMDETEDEAATRWAEDGHMSQAFLAIVQKAIREDCMLINFDMAVDEDDSLPTFDW